VGDEYESDEVLDPRSTGRKRGRKTLEREGFPYWCASTRDGDVNSRYVRGLLVGCGRSPSAEDAPGGVYPNMGALQVQHKNKNVMDNDPANLEWLCSSCHKVEDSQTEKGVSLKGDEHGYGFDLEGLLDD
jgi:hypothetical protein